MDQKIMLNHTKQSYLKLLVLSVIFTNIVGCGGGGGIESTSGIINDDSEIEATTSAVIQEDPEVVIPRGEFVSGTAIKGVVVNADIIAYEIIDNQIGSDPLIITTTDYEGNYQLQLPYKGIEMLHIVLSGRTDGSTTVRCDIVAGCMQMSYFYKFGENYPVDSSFVLSAMSETDGAALSIHITPLTHIVAETVKNEFADIAFFSKSSSGSLLATANKKVALAFGLDDVPFTKLVPIDITRITNYDNLQSNQLKAILFGAAVSTLDDPTRSDDGIADSLNRIIELTKSNETLLHSEAFKKFRAGVMQTAMQLRIENPNLPANTVLAEIETKLRQTVDTSMLLADILKPPVFSILELAPPVL
jgi:hypothetical protein